MPERTTKRKNADSPKAPARTPHAPQPPGPPAAHQFAVETAQLLADDKCSDIVVLDVRNMSQVSDFIVIGTGTSDRQMASALEHTAELGEHRGHTVFRRSLDDRGTWLLLDFVDVVVHLFEPNTRAHYDLEMLWGDAPRLEWARPPGSKPPRADGAAPAPRTRVRKASAGDGAEPAPKGRRSA